MAYSKEQRKEYYLKNKEKLKEYSRKYNLKNKEQAKKHSKKYYLNHKKERKKWNFKNKEKFKEYYLKHRYNITLDQLKQMFISQNGVCAICKEKFANRKAMHIDHNHVNGKVRALLCPPCNYAVGNVRENIEYAKSLVEYLQKWNQLP